MDFLCRCFCAVWMIFLYSTISSSKSIFVMVVSHRQTSAPIALLDICIGPSMLRDWLTAAFFCTVFLVVIRLVLRLVSVVALWFALPAVGYALLPAVRLCSSRLYSSFLLLFSTVNAALRAHRRFDVLLAVIVPVLLYFHLLNHWLVGCGSVCDSHHWLLGSGFASDPPRDTSW